MKTTIGKLNIQNENLSQLKRNILQIYYNYLKFKFLLK
jgi:hypothetical protein